MKTNILGLVVTLVVGIILAGSLMMPAISDASSIKYTNVASNGVEYIYSDNFTVSKEASSTDVVINGVTFTNAGPNALILAPETILYQTGNPINFFDSTGAYTNLTNVAFSGTCTDGTFVYTIGTDEAVTVTLTDPLVAVKSGGEYVSINSGSANVRDGADIISWTWTSGANILYNGSEVVVTPTSEVDTDFAYTIADGKVSFNSLAFTYGETTIPGNTLIVPKSYAIANEYATLYSAIPVLVIVSLVLAAVAVIINSKRD